MTDDNGDKPAIVEDQTIWFPGFYRGLQGPYAQKAGAISREKLVDLVQARATIDGEWAIQTDRVGENEELMRKMMEWVSRPNNIIQCYEANIDIDPTVDWICRHLAEAARTIGGSVGG